MPTLDTLDTLDTLVLLKIDTLVLLSTPTLKDIPVDQQKAGPDVDGSLLARRAGRMALEPTVTLAAALDMSLTISMTA